MSAHTSARHVFTYRVFAYQGARHALRSSTFGGPCWRRPTGWGFRRDALLGVVLFVDDGFAAGAKKSQSDERRMR